MSKPAPPHRYVPTLTEVVDASAGEKPKNPDVNRASSIPAALEAGVDSNAPPSAIPSPNRSNSDFRGFDEDIVRRILQRAEVGLDYRLRRCLNQIVQQHTQAILTDLQREVQSVLRDAVGQALAEEISRRQVNPNRP